MLDLQRRDPQDPIEDGTLLIEYRDIATLGDDSLNASIGARAAGEQGLYWEYHAALVEETANGDHPTMPTDKLLELAEQVGVPNLTQLRGHRLPRAV
ncbi:MAG: hypothetical protein WA880_12880 [Ornithinimicrobium sp.]